jgi:hypothetical protein
MDVLLSCRVLAWESDMVRAMGWIFVPSDHQCRARCLPWNDERGMPSIVGSALACYAAIDHISPAPRSMGVAQLGCTMSAPIHLVSRYCHYLADTIFVGTHGRGINCDSGTLLTRRRTITRRYINLGQSIFRRATLSRLPPQLSSIINMSNSSVTIR